ncbi:MAG: high-affinity branched-chain amino acid ABC transporter substrate-binding protein [Pseudomonadota bacterium]|nr:high-affinity branched-chain amino acid ABC transporter substrate-binding protein [Pseudomonadota bacterium]
MHRIFQWTLAAAAALSLAQGAAASGPLKVAVAGPQTGPVAQFGDMVRTGVDFAVAAINQAGGVGGSKIEVVHYDDACDPKQAVAVANRIVNDKIKFVVGHVCSAATQAASDVYADEDVLIVTPSATAPAITERGHKLVFRTIGLDSAQAPVAAQYILQHHKGKTIAVLHDKQQYGEGLASSVKKALEQASQPVALYEGLNAGDKDYSALIAKLKRANAELVYFGGYHGEMGLLLRQARQAGLNAVFMGGDGAGNQEISAIAGDASEGMLVTLPRAFEKDPKNKALVDRFAAAKKDPSGVYVLPGYAALQVIAQGIQKAGAADPVKVAAALRAGSFDTPIGQIGFDAKGDVKNFQFIVYRWHKDGSKTELK